LQLTAATMTEKPPLQSCGTNCAASCFAVYTSSRHEKRVAKQFCEHGFDNFLPLVEKAHHWKKRTAVQLHLPLFPNYVFVHIAPRQRTAVLAVPGVLAIVGSGHIPSPLPDNEIEMLRTSPGARPKPGAFRGHQLTTNYARNRRSPESVSRCGIRTSNCAASLSSRVFTVAWGERLIS